MSPYPADPVDATGPMRIVLVAAPVAASYVLGRGAVARRFAAWLQRISNRSTFWWQGQREETDETLLLFKTVPKRVGALFRYIERVHPYDVPEIIELAVPRVSPRYLAYLTTTLGAVPIPPRPIRHRVRVTRPGSRRARGARSPRRTRGRLRHP